MRPSGGHVAARGAGAERDAQHGAPGQRHRSEQRGHVAVVDDVERDAVPGPLEIEEHVSHPLLERVGRDAAEQRREPHLVVDVDAGRAAADGVDVRQVLGRASQRIHDPVPVILRIGLVVGIPLGLLAPDDAPVDDAPPPCDRCRPGRSRCGSRRGARRATPRCSSARAEGRASPRSRSGDRRRARRRSRSRSGRSGCRDKYARSRSAMPAGASRWMRKPPRAHSASLTRRSSIVKFASAASGSEPGSRAVAKRETEPSFCSSAKRASAGSARRARVLLKRTPGERGRAKEGIQHRRHGRADGRQSPDCVVDRHVLKLRRRRQTTTWTVSGWGDWPPREARACGHLKNAHVTVSMSETRLPRPRRPAALRFGDQPAGSEGPRCSPASRGARRSPASRPAARSLA